MHNARTGYTSLFDSWCPVRLCCAVLCCVVHFDSGNWLWRCQTTHTDCSTAALSLDSRVRRACQICRDSEELRLPALCGADRMRGPWSGMHDDMLGSPFSSLQSVSISAYHVFFSSSSSYSVCRRRGSGPLCSARLNIRDVGFWPLLEVGDLAPLEMSGM